MATKRKRRGHGEGSIYQRESDGKWVGVIDYGYVPQPDGSRKRKRQIIYGKTRKEVADKLPALVLERRAATKAPEQQSVGQFLDQWLSDVVKSTVRPRTYQSYKERVEGKIKPIIGSVILSKLTPRHIQNLMTAHVALAPGTRRHIRSVLRIALNYAVRMEYINRNPVQLVAPPPVRDSIAQILKPDEARRLLDAVRGDRLEALYTVALALGLRRGEIAALKWTDVDLVGGVLHVEHTLVRVNSKLVTMTTKTEKSRRRISLPSVVVTALKQHKIQQEMERQRAGSKWIDAGYIFTNRNGTPLAIENMSGALQKHLARAGLQPVRLHDLRHSCASFLLAQGVPPKVVQEILGHSSIKITMDIYAHVLPEAHSDAADRMDDLLRKRG